MDRLRAERAQVRRLFTVARKVCEATLEKPESTAGEVNVVFAKFADKADRLFLLDNQVRDHIFQSEISEDELAAEYDSVEEYREAWLTLSTRRNERVDNFRAATTCPSVSGPENFALKLPKLDLPKLDINPKTWITFWACFKKIHEREDLPPEDKFQLLLRVAKDGTQAKELLSSYPASATNYAKAFDQLKNRFGRDELLIELYVRELLSLVLVQASGKVSLTLAQLYDKLETQLMALESLGVTSEKYACMLTPLVESALPEPTLREWERKRKSRTADGSLLEAADQMVSLREFLKREVESEERFLLARSTFSAPKERVSTTKPSVAKAPEGKVSTAAGLVDMQSQDNQKEMSCVFCDSSAQHPSELCSVARDKSREEKIKILRAKNRCFRCLGRFHGKRPCRGTVCCLVCADSHSTVMCVVPRTRVSAAGESDGTAKESKVDHSYASIQSAPVLMQTLKVRLRGENPITTRLLIDTGSQRSYITRDLAARMQYKSLRTETLVHALFGGSTTEPKDHHCYKVRLQSMMGDFLCNFEVLDSGQICHAVPTIPKGPWSAELSRMKIELSDDQEGPIGVLVGADVAGKLLTGRREVLSCGLVAVETSLGWTIMGRIRDAETSCMANINLHAAQVFDAADMWKLDVLGIEDPACVSTKEEATALAREHFQRTVKVLQDGRYEVCLPWLKGHTPLPRNFHLAAGRLETTLTKLQRSGLVRDYEAVFNEWLTDGIIEEVSIEGWDSGHYLPHRAVVKEGSTTRIRPVFDASSKGKGEPSLNMCLEKGDNYVELIPSVLLRFRLGRLGVISDIKKAFLQISVAVEDRDCLRFLWKDESGKMKIYRHRRVVFGVTSSPFLLGAVINYHLLKCEKQVANGEASYSLSVISQLRKCLYVDNCVTSVTDEKEMMDFVSQATALFLEARMELRGWEWSDPELTGDGSHCTPVLGLLWDKKDDVLRIYPPRPLEEDMVTRRSVMSATHRIFDPLGICSPAILTLRLLVQDSWTEEGNWETPFNEKSQAIFRKWMGQADALNRLEVPRWLRVLPTVGNVSLHTFCDASGLAYATVSFLRVEADGVVTVIFVGAKARVAPLKKPTIPRLELLAALIGARMASSMVKEIGEVECYFWTDSSTALCWIKKEEPWGIFVYNRVKEIRSVSSPEMWKHVPGVMNPADLPSRGCFPSELLESRWWEGPEWLYRPPSDWPNSDGAPDENEVSVERRKGPVISAMSHEPCVFSCERIAHYFSSFHRIVRMVAWMIRFLWNKYSKKEKFTGELSVKEIMRAEKLIVRVIQDESFTGLEDKLLKKLKPQKDASGLMRLRTRIWARKEPEDFRAPYILPSQHVIGDRMILDLHKQNGHIGGQGLLNLLRERFWIVKGRLTVKRIVSACVICRRYKAKALKVETPPLPESRVRDARLLEVSGTDFAGPLYLKNGDKVWVCIFTCAVYRATHLELVTSLSTEAFTMAFRRFIAHFGRPSIMYSDNGTNYKGFKNALDGIDWQKVASRSSVDQIQWRFNPPTAAWWGGFWERLIGILKVHLRKILGRASLTFEELNTVISECAAFINSRPITYTSDDPCDPVPITPQMFIGDIQELGVPDLDEIEKTSLQRRVKRRLETRESLKQRFRSEYLGQMFMTASQLKNPREPKVGEVVLIGSDNQKRVDWPMAVVEELIFGNDGQCRVVKLRTQDGRLTRPVQRVYPLEVPLWEQVNAEGPQRKPSPGLPTANSTSSEDPDVVESVQDAQLLEDDQPISAEDPQKTKVVPCVTRCGRKVSLPIRFL